MKRLILVIWILCLISGCSDNKKKTDPHFPLAQKYSATSLKEDFEQLLRVAKKNHPALFDFISKNEYDRLSKQQHEKITDSLTVNEFYNVIQPLVNEIGCGHSGVHLPDWIWRDSTVTVLPIKLFIHSGRAYVINNYIPNDELKVGAEILSINGITIALILKRLEASISTDGRNLSAKTEVLNQSFNRLLAIQEGFPQSYKINYRITEPDSTGSMIISSINAQSYFDAQPKVNSLFQFEIDSARSTAVITIKSFGFYEKLQEFKTFVDTSFSQIRRAQINNVILDLRNNGGGDPFCAAYLLSHLAKAPVTYFSKTYDPYTDLAKPISLSINHFSGHLYTLINGICFSTTGHLCALLKYHSIGEFIGTETGGTYTCNDDSQTFQLINTGILVRMPRATFSVAVEGIPRFKGILPDHIIEPSLEDIVNSNDRVKEFALSRIEANSNRD